MRQFSIHRLKVTSAAYCTRIIKTYLHLEASGSSDEFTAAECFNLEMNKEQ